MCEGLGALGETDRIIEVGEARWKELEGSWCGVGDVETCASARQCPHRAAR